MGLREYGAADGGSGFSRFGVQDEKIDQLVNLLLSVKCSSWFQLFLEVVQPSVVGLLVSK